MSRNNPSLRQIEGSSPYTHVSPSLVPMFQIRAVYFDEIYISCHVLSFKYGQLAIIKFVNVLVGIGVLTAVAMKGTVTVQVHQILEEGTPSIFRVNE
jgi:hypothetical protein